METSTEVPVSKAAGGVPSSHVVADIALRVLLFASCLISVIVLITGNEREIIPLSLNPLILGPHLSEWRHSPAFIYQLAALSVAGLYSIITTFLSFTVLPKPGRESTRLLFQFAILDALLLGIVAAGTGTAGGVAYIGLVGNKHTRWTKICNIYGHFCRHLAASILISGLASFALLGLVWLSLYTLSKKIMK